MINKFDQTAIVIVEVTEEGKSPDLKYVTIGNIGRNATDAEFAEEALNYIKSAGKKEVKAVVFANNEQYRIFIENNIHNLAGDK